MTNELTTRRHMPAIPALELDGEAAKQLPDAPDVELQPDAD